MKNYFNFSLSGNKLFPYWAVMLLSIVCLAVFVGINLGLKAVDIQHNDPKEFIILIPVLLVFYFVMFAISFYIYKLHIVNIVYKEQQFVFNGTLGQFIITLLLGILLSIITLGIYTPWFVRKMSQFFVNNSSYHSESLEFKGKGGELLLIFLFTLLLPYVFIGIFTGVFTIANQFNDTPLLSGLIQIITTIILIPFYYFLYKWMVNIKYKDYIIVWKTDTWDACMKILGQVLLIIITFGIYSPLAYLRLYKYFAERTVATSPDKTKKFGYDLEPGDDFFYIWGQILLTIITIGIYYPWANCKIAQRVLSKSYSENVVTTTTTEA